MPTAILENNQKNISNYMSVLTSIAFIMWDIREFQQEFTTDLPKIYQPFTNDLPKIYQK